MPGNRFLFYFTLFEKVGKYGGRWNSTQWAIYNEPPYKTVKQLSSVATPVSGSRLNYTINKNNYQINNKWNSKARNKRWINWIGLAETEFEIID